MELSQIKILLKDPAKLITKVQACRPDDDNGALQYQPENHAVHDDTIRKNRVVVIPNPYGLKDEATGELKLTDSIEPVARISTAAQKQIVTWAVQIAAGVPVEATGEPKTPVEENMLAMLRRTLTDNKMQYLDQEILRLTAIYKICAEIWISEPCKPEFWGDLAPRSKFKMRLIILSEETGDKLYPVKNVYGKMIALGREYKTINDLDKEVLKFDLFLQDSIKTYSQEGSGWELEGERKVPYGKANFIVHQQARREWEDVQSKIDRLETLDSNAADQNDATGSPLIAVSGQVEGFGKRGDTGKVFQLENGGDIKVIEAAGAPEAVKMERENLVKGIFDETNTPMLSFDDAQGFGANIPGITLKLLFLPATLKALSRQSGGWGMSIQRRYNFLLYALAKINVEVAGAKDMDVLPKFSIYMPSNDTENYNNIINLVAAGLLSKLKAISLLGLVDDAKAEIEQLAVEAKTEAPKLEKPLKVA